ncbi:FIST C-terminal domain-containing protein, partial [Christensenellaceae bacterium OttesenSCG-928-L17]|nr:FIST C-terminal domain-containing protein [Christensenellaceae bacterium OttesenSCG-928-L17]
EYIDTGVYKALCEHLPFEVIGATTVENMVAGEIDETMLTLLVLTSDEVSFATAFSDAVTGEEEAPLRALYQSARQKLPGDPAMMLTFMPLLTTLGSDFYVDCMSAINGNVPNFGPVTVDHNADYHDSQVLLNGESWRDRIAILLMHGPVKPTFLIGSISEDRVFPEKGVVTASVGNQLQSVNGMSMIDFLQSIGLPKNEEGGITGINSFPIIVDYNDGTTPVARTMFALTPEGHAVCGGNIPVGSTLSIGSFDPEELISTTSAALEEVSRLETCGTVLMYSCIGRYFTQGYNQKAELQKVADYLDNTKLTYMAAYSGGELCPVYNKGGQTINRNHNNTFIVCAF